jgi:hypothetical protein
MTKNESIELVRELFSPPELVAAGIVVVLALGLTILVAFTIAAALAGIPAQ